MVNPLDFHALMFSNLAQVGEACRTAIAITIGPFVNAPGPITVNAPVPITWRIVLIIK